MLLITIAVVLGSYRSDFEGFEGLMVATFIWMPMFIIDILVYLFVEWRYQRKNFVVDFLRIRRHAKLALWVGGIAFLLKVFFAGIGTYEYMISGSDQFNMLLVFLNSLLVTTGVYIIALFILGLVVYRLARRQKHFVRYLVAIMNVLLFISLTSIPSMIRTNLSLVAGMQSDREFTETIESLDIERCKNSKSLSGRSCEFYIIEVTLDPELCDRVAFVTKERCLEVINAGTK